LLRAFRPDLQSVTLRGNVPTRVEKLRAGEAEAVILAAAGLERLQGVLDLDGLATAWLDPALFVPAPAQGAIALQCRRDDPIEEALADLHDEAVAFTVGAERELLRLVEGGCDLPFGAWCRSIGNKELEMIAFLEIDGAIVRERRRGKDPGELADRVWNGFVARGARRGPAAAGTRGEGDDGAAGSQREIAGQRSEGGEHRGAEEHGHRLAARTDDGDAEPGD
jgi:porphobilinogen deaminase